MAYSLRSLVNLKVNFNKAPNIQQTAKLISENVTVPVMSVVADDLIIVTKADELPL